VTRLTLGLGAEDLAPQWLDVPAGEHVLVLGTARSGVTTALTQLARSWARQHGHARVAWWPTAGPGAGDEAGLPDHGGDRPRLVVVDDAHRIDDDGRLAALAAGPTRTTLLVGARVETVRASYGHWTRDAARSRCGIVMTSTGVPDGELLGASLPVRTRIPARPGLGWVIDGAGPRLVQVARPGSRSR
jgi:S-DNA-T family DNA segregation ATPase FtsK/SpoIIIE